MNITLLLRRLKEGDPAMFGTFVGKLADLMEQSENPNSRNEFVKTLEVTLHFFFADRESVHDMELLTKVIEGLVEREILSERCPDIQHTLINKNLLDIFQRITNSPECHNFLHFLFGKIMYAPGQATSMLERMGEGGKQARKWLAEFMQEMMGKVLGEEFQLVP